MSRSLNYALIALTQGPHQRSLVYEKGSHDPVAKLTLLIASEQLESSTKLAKAPSCLIQEPFLNPLLLYLMNLYG